MQKLTLENITSAVDWLKYWAALIPSVKALVLLIGIDIASGWLLAFSKHTLNSSTSFSGMCKKVAILLMVTMGQILEPFANGVPLTLMFATGFVFQEVLSITENMAAMGVPIPQSVVDVLDKVQTGRKAKLEQRSKSPLVEGRGVADSAVAQAQNLPHAHPDAPRQLIHADSSAAPQSNP